MEERVRLNVMGISYNQLQSGAFALLLAQENGPYRIPVVIGAAEAQSIAIRLEGVTPPRPLTHDLFDSFAQAFGVRLKEVFIYNFEDGIFYSELTFTDGGRTVVLDARTSDAIAIAMRCHAPIWTTQAIIEETGFIIEEGPDGVSTARRPEPDEVVPGSYSPGEYVDDYNNVDDPAPERLAVEELEKLLSKLIDDENYEEAARISAILKDKRGNDNQLSR